MRINPLAGDDAARALDKIEHIVVLMLENRSFDHMLGYLSLNGRTDVDGLTATCSNSYKGRTYPVHRVRPGPSAPHQDPNHSGRWVEHQIAGGAMSGFVQSYVESIDPAHRAAALAEPESFVMGYFDGADLFAYDHLAASYCICDRWFASVPGATWPNRLYAIAGESGGRFDNKRLFNKIDFPFFALPSFVRHLDEAEATWRWYHSAPSEFEPPTLQLVDPRYLLTPGDHFALIDEPEPLTGQASFLDDAAAGRLPNVSWLDPNFYATPGRPQNDDHPPTDVSHGQRLVQTVANAVMSGPRWAQTMLVVLYDEHGGFFDHVPPPAAADDRPEFRRYGVRVPSFVVSAYVDEQSVTSTTYDHTSIIKTILQRFCVRDGRIPSMGARVDAAEHLGGVLTSATAREPAPIPSPSADGSTVDALAAGGPRVDEGPLATLRHTSAHHLPRVLPGVIEPRPDPDLVAASAGDRPNDLQLGLAAMAGELRFTRSGAT